MIDKELHILEQTAFSRLFPNQKVGRWTVSNVYTLTARGEKKFLCKCDCGTERFVLERSLRHSGSLSCGCLRKEKAAEAVAHDLAGKTFGDLTVLSQSSRETKQNGIWWNCVCSCGNTCEVLGTLLVTGRKTHCGCKTEWNQPTADITGKRFHRLTALHPTEFRDAKGNVIWHCKCDCGNEVDVSYNQLMYANIKSCGCQKKEHDQALSGYLTHVANTSVEMLKSKKIPSNNTTGVKGVYFIRGRYVAKIVFQKKAYYLGTYYSIDDAAEARKKAESVLNDEVVEFYEKWSARADADPEWAKENPIQIKVTQDEQDRLIVRILPEI